MYLNQQDKNGTMYIGVTSNLVKRMYEHKQGLLEGFTKKYKVKDLVYTEWIPAAVYPSAGGDGNDSEVIRE